MRNTRSGSQGQSAPPPPQSIEVVRRRARHRLIGAAVLVLVAVLGFPLLFDTQPRPIPVDIPIEIPSRLPTPPATAEASARARPPAQATVAASESLSAREEVVTPSSGNAAVAERTAPAVPTPAPAAAPAKPEEVKPAPSGPANPAPDSSRPLVGKPVDSKPVAAPAPPATETAAERDKDKSDGLAAAGNERIVVQVGAFAEVERAREARLKLERAGLKTYTHVAETPQGRRIRVRLGPYPTKAEADKAAARAKALGLPAQLLWL